MQPRVVHSLVLCRNLLLTAAVAVALVPLPASARQSAAAQPPSPEAPQSPVVPDWQTAAGGKTAFDVASIRPSQPGTSTPANISMETDDYYRPTGGLFIAGRTLETYINFAYKLHPAPEHREGMYGHLPKWVTTESFSIQARAAGNVTQKDQMRLMMQSLLAERFKLVVHFEQRNQPVFALRTIRAGKLGPGLRPHADGPPCSVPASRTGAVPSPASATPAGGSVDYPFLCGAYHLIVEPDRMILWGSRDVPMAMLATWIAVTPPGNLGRPVTDQTGLRGSFDFALEWQVPDSDAAPETESGPSGPTLEEAVKQQLGLKLQPTHAPVSVLVIDHVELPSPN